MLQTLASLKSLKMEQPDKNILLSLLTTSLKGNRLTNNKTT